MPVDVDVISDTSSIGSDSDIDDIVVSHPMYHILNQFLRTDDGTNITTCLQNLVNEIKDLKKMIASKK